MDGRRRGHRDQNAAGRKRSDGGTNSVGAYQGDRAMEVNGAARLVG